MGGHKKATELLFDGNNKLHENVKIFIQRVDLGNAQTPREIVRSLRHYEQKAMDYFENIPKINGSQNGGGLRRFLRLKSLLRSQKKN